MGMLDGKVALVTGAGGGIGREHALLLAKEGASVVVNDLGGNPDGTGKGTSMADEVVELIRKEGGKAAADYGNVASSDDAKAMVKKAVDEFGRLDILINNAGILRDKAFKNMDEELWNIVLDVHLNGTYHVTRAGYLQMLEQNEGGRIIMTSSTSGLFGNFGQCNYGAAKAGIAGIMRSLHPEAIKRKITVNVIAPGAATRLTVDVPGFSAMADKLPPELISPLVVWLCTDEAAKITGYQFLIFGNKISICEPTPTPICDKPGEEGPWEVAEVGAQVLEKLKGHRHKTMFG